MGYLSFILRSTFDDFKKNKLRTFLTSLGILIGVFAVILLNALGLGLKEYIKQQFESLGSNTLYLIPGNFQSSASFRSYSSLATGIRFDEEDVKTLTKIKKISFISPLLNNTAKVVGTKESKLTSFVGANAQIFSILNLQIEHGRLFDKNDVAKKNKVAVLGYKIAEKLYGSKTAALGRSLKMNNQNFKVIGVLGHIAGVEALDDHNFLIFVPYTSLPTLNGKHEFLTIYLKAQDNQSIEEVKKEAKVLLLKKYKEKDFTILDQREILESVVAIFNILNSALIAIAAVSLIVGGVGIMNIMYVSVTEKINEIGLRRCVGATKKDILFQFLLEAVILSLAGGLIGLTLTFLVVFVIQNFFPAYINFQAVLLTLFITSGIGIFFGILPAKKAASLTPIEAIKTT